MKNPEFKVKVKDKKWDLIFNQDKPTIIDAHIQDGLVLTRIFEGVLRRKSGGNKVGILIGQQQVFDVDLKINDEEEMRMRTLVFRLNSGDQIIAQGLSIYRAGENKFKPGKMFTIAVIGGTGKYIGVRGQLVTLLRADGTYRHKFRFTN
jgi:uncharacterized protein involved in tellurium resistance